MEAQYEIKDIAEMIRRFAITNKNEVTFIGTFMAFDEEGNIKDDANLIFAYGCKGCLRIALNELRDTIEDEAEEGWVNI